ncbi:SPFH domain-containing protein [Actinoplanes regularis]|uniref:Membrane protease subunit, stomatin/prohibitin family, contains C-terminal Zn-ribbon domain n=1 Tax=Actinoplanes regularis TaxID=52697 RepID=A0A239HTC8_9ACTN|nr:SPFH domain-containing protein [Actinoplanes regularis]GIE91094.1 antifreeze protein, type I [Actinoplanes regularis]SNS83504.1 Membrane protease subunit, stomatin/prohibitin family, contains C-terminal Zn-ribbon domain [Actinoplanes regularis]
MGLWDKLKGELVDIVEWLDDSRDTIVWRFPRYENEIKMGAKLVVRESQVAVFVDEGRIADVFAPGTHTLTTQNLPILSTLKGWKYGFESPWKAEVYFVNTRQFTDMKWGTQNPVIVRDAEFGAVRLRAFGSFAMRVSDPARLLTELVGTDPQFRTAEVQEYLRQLVVSHLGSALATAGVPVLDLAAKQQSLGVTLSGVLTEELASSGIAIPRFIIENISVPPEVEQALDKRVSMGVVGNLDAYTKFQTANAIEDAANNPGGAGDAFGIGIGMAAGQRATQAMSTPPGVATPPPLPVGEWFAALDGRQQGPFDVATLAGHATSGTLTRETLVWRNGMAGWTAAGQVAELNSVFAAVPPPLPPQG